LRYKPFEFIYEFKELSRECVHAHG
jgi:hypothetical protein